MWYLFWLLVYPGYPFLTEFCPGIRFCSLRPGFSNKVNFVSSSSELYADKCRKVAERPALRVALPSPATVYLLQHGQIP
jgi:hypothetical protein